jgi:glycosyltransferase involved in cell wall biosynthesis
MSILEAMSSGRPVVSTAVGGVPEQLANGECGLLTPPGDSEALAKAIIKLLQDSDARESIGSRARARATALYSLDRMTERYMKLYTSELPTR